MATRPQTATVTPDGFIAAAGATDARLADRRIVALAGTSLELGLAEVYEGCTRGGRALRLINRTHMGQR